MKQIAIFATLIAAALCRPAEEILNYQADSQFHTQNGNAGVAVEGHFGYEGPDGKTYKLKYRADDNGFVAEGDHLPVAPEVPPTPVVENALTPIADAPAEQKAEEVVMEEKESVDIVASDPADKETPTAASSAAVRAVPIATPLLLPQAAVYSQGDSTNYPAATGPLPTLKFAAPVPAVIPAPVHLPVFAPAPLPLTTFYRAPGVVVEKAVDDPKLPASTKSLVVPKIEVVAPLHYPAAAPLFWV